MPKTININKDFFDNLVVLIKNKDQRKLQKSLLNMHHADIAEIITNLSDFESQFLYENLHDEIAALVLKEVEDEKRKTLLSKLSAKEIAVDVIDNLESDDAVDVISDLSEKKKEEVLSHIENEDYANDLSDLLKYEENTAGSMMATELIKVNENWNTLECLKKMRKQAEYVKKVHTIYVVNNNNKLLGTMSLKRLLISNKDTKVRDIVNSDVYYVKTDTSTEEIANLMNKYDLIILPVVNENQELLGRITIDDVIDVVKEEAEKDYQMASGIYEDIENNAGILTITRVRLPWLIIGMIGGVLGAKVIGVFDIQKHFELALFIPLIAAMGGNVGVQSAAIVVQSLANKSIDIKNISEKLTKELGVGLLNGLICGCLVFLFTYILGYNLLLGLTVSLSLIIVIIFAALFGTFIPLTLQKYNVDPAVATGPFITTISDILGLLIYFLIGQTILQ
ncbi:MAG: magnesium transporter [Candidatus Marinimicrobia bacterium]|nr:magnesium transporter [Candidatus Neomarinimicrobiota bacterium]|tara:strand:- start:827 stop:2179 length:1353 start_codon:yes stop_codon:yes gene_type:complete